MPSSLNFTLCGIPSLICEKDAVSKLFCIQGGSWHRRKEFKVGNKKLNYVLKITEQEFEYISP